MALIEEIASLENIEGKLTENKVANFCYEDSAYENIEEADGVEDFDYARAQNIPVADNDVIKLDDVVTNKGFRSQASSLPRMAINHFFGRVSYNLNKTVDTFKAFLTSFKNSLGSANGLATLDENGKLTEEQNFVTREYLDLENVTNVSTVDTLSSVLDANISSKGIANFIKSIFGKYLWRLSTKANKYGVATFIGSAGGKSFVTTKSETMLVSTDSGEFTETNLNLYEVINELPNAFSIEKYDAVFILTINSHLMLTSLDSINWTRTNTEKYEGASFIKYENAIYTLSSDLKKIIKIDTSTGNVTLGTGEEDFSVASFNSITRLNNKLYLNSEGFTTYTTGKTTLYCSLDDGLTWNNVYFTGASSQYNAYYQLGQKDSTIFAYYYKAITGGSIKKDSLVYYSNADLSFIPASINLTDVPAGDNIYPRDYKLFWNLQGTSFLYYEIRFTSGEWKTILLQSTDCINWEQVNDVPSNLTNRFYPQICQGRVFLTTATNAAYYTYELTDTGIIESDINGSQAKVISDIGATSFLSTLNSSGTYDVYKVTEETISKLNIETFPNSSIYVTKIGNKLFVTNKNYLMFVSTDTETWVKVMPLSISSSIFFVSDTDYIIFDGTYFINTKVIGFPTGLISEDAITWIPSNTPNGSKVELCTVQDTLYLHPLQTSILYVKDNDAYVNISSSDNNSSTIYYDGVNLYKLDTSAHNTLSFLSKLN